MLKADSALTTFRAFYRTINATARSMLIVCLNYSVTLLVSVIIHIFTYCYSF